MTVFQNPADPQLYQILDKAKIIAMVGASSKPGRPSHGIMKKLQSAGYRVIPVNPNETEILGEKTYPSLLEIPSSFPIDIVNVFRKGETTPPVAEDAVKTGAKILWLQLGITNDEVVRICEQAGIGLVMDSCIGVDYARLRVPAKN